MKLRHQKISYIKGGNNTLLSNPISRCLQRISTRSIRSKENYSKTPIDRYGIAKAAKYRVAPSAIANNREQQN